MFDLHASVIEEELKEKEQQQINNIAMLRAETQMLQNPTVLFIVSGGPLKRNSDRTRNGARTRNWVCLYPSLVEPQLHKNSFYVHNKLMLMLTESNAFPLHMWKTTEETKKIKILAACAKEISLDANLAAVSPLKARKWHSLFFFFIL